MNRSWRFALLLGAVLVAVVLVAGAPSGGGDGDPLSPDGTGPTGARATVLLLEELGADVDEERAIPGAGVDTALLLADTLTEERRDDLVDWVADGGTLVVADAASPLTPAVAGALDPFALGSAIDVRAGACDVDQLADARVLELVAAAQFEVPPGAPSCFGDGEVAYVVELGFERGRVLAVGGPNPFTNAALDQADNAVLVADLVAPEPEGADVAFLVEAPVGAGEEGLSDLVPDRIVLALLQLGLAFLVYVWFRARRAGRPVAEPLPTPLAGSELVAAVGRLYQQERDPQRAADLLRDDLTRTLAGRLGLAPDVGGEELVAAVERAGTDPTALRQVLAGPPVTDGDALARYARTIDQTRREVLHEQP